MILVFRTGRWRKAFVKHKKKLAREAGFFQASAECSSSGS
jgi:hypothetical protein